MSRRKEKKLKWVLDAVPAGHLVDSPTLDRHGVTRQLAHRYVESNWLEPVIRGLYRRPGGASDELHWRTVVRSLQHIMGYSSVVGGLTALDEQGFAHYLPMSDERTIHLYGDSHPTWLRRLDVAGRFALHGSKLFDEDVSQTTDVDTGAGALACSTPERAVLEAIDELPNHSSFDNIDKIFEGLTSLRPKHLMTLLSACRSVKVRRLFFVFADRHEHAWRKYLDADKVDFGSGPRALVKGGKLHPTYRIYVPQDFVPKHDAEADSDA